MWRSVMASNILRTKMMLKLAILISVLPQVIANRLVEDELLSSLAHNIDMAAMELTHEHISHSRERRQTYDKFHETVKYTRSVSERQKVIIRRIVPEQLIEQNHPHDVKVFSLNDKEVRNKESFSGRELFLAIAENYHGNKNYSSYVKIHRFNEATAKFDFETALSEYAPHRIEFFTLSTDGKHSKHFLAVGGLTGYSKEHSTETSLSIYSFGNGLISNLTRIFNNSMSVSAIKYVHVEGIDMLIVADRKSSFTSFLTVLRYNSGTNTFELKTRYPVSLITDIEAVEIAKITYIIVSVYEDYFGKLVTKSLVFKYVTKHQSFELHHKFQTSGALDIEVFNPSINPYLILSNEASGMSTSKQYNTRAVVYSIGRNFQMKTVSSIETTGARQTTSITLPNCQHKRLVVSIDSRISVDQVGVHFFDDVKESISNVPVTFFDGVPTTFRPRPNRVISFSVGNKVFVVLAAENQNASNVFTVEYEVQDVSSPYSVLVAQINKEMNDITENIAAMESLLADTERTLRNVVYKDTNQTIYGKKTFISNLSVEDVKIAELTIVNGSIYHKKDGILSSVDQIRYENNITIDELEKKQSKQTSLIDNIDKRLEQVYFVDQPSNITGIKHMKSVKFVSDATIENINELEYVNDIDFPFLLKDIVRQGKDEVISGLKSFDDVIIDGNLLTNASINNMDLSKEAVTLTGDQTIRASKTVRNNMVFSQNLDLSGTVNGVDIGDEAVPLDADVKILGKKTFVDSIVLSNATIDGLIDGVNVTELAADTLKTTGNYTITGKKIFMSSVSSEDNIEVDGLVNGEDLKKFSESVIRVNATNHSKGQGSITFLDPVYIDGDLQITGKLNQINFPDDVVLVNKSQTITGIKTFMEDVTVLGDVECLGLVDGLNTSDLVTLSTEQHVTGKKIFTGNLTLKENLIVENWTTINGINIRKMAAEIMTVDKDHYVTGNINFDQLITFNNDLKIEGKIDDVTVSYYQELFNNSLLLEGDQIITGYNTFMGDIKVRENLSVRGKINGYSFPRDFLMTSSDQNITGRFRFNGDVKFMGNVTVEGLVSGIDLKEFAKRIITIDGNETVTGRKTFNSNVVVHGDILCRGKINGIYTHYLMTKNTTQIVTAAKYFDAASFENVMAVKSNVSVRETVNGIDLSELKARAVYKDRDMHVKGMIHIHGDVSAKNIKTSTINGIDISELKRDAVTLSTDQIINSTKHFTHMLIEKHLVTNSTIDGINVAEMAKDIVTVNGSSVITGNKTFERVRIVKDCTVEGLVNNVNITELNNSVVLRSDSVNFPGEIQIVGDVHLSKDIKVGKMNGLDPDKDFVFKTKPQNITGFKTFVNDVNVRGNITVNGKINDVNLSLLASEAVLKNVPQVIRGKKVLNNVRVNGNITVDGHVDGIDLKELNRSILRIDRYQEVPESITFTGGIIFEQNLVVDGLVNKYNLRKIYEDAVTINGSQNITGKKIFSTGIKIENNLTVNGDMKLRGLLDNVNVSLLNSEFLDVYKDQNITSIKSFVRPVRFENNVKIMGKLSGMNISDFVTIYGDHVISGQKTFLNGLKLIGNATVRMLIDGEDIRALQNDTLLQNEPNMQSVTGEKRFLIGPIFNEDVHVKGLIDGVNLSDVLNITLDSPQVISHPLTFQNLHVEADIVTNNSRLGKKLEDLWQNRITLDTEQVITGDIEFYKNVNVMNDIIVNGTVNGIDVSKFQQFINDTTRRICNEADRSNQRITNQCKALDFVETVLRAWPSRLDFFEDHQTFSGLQTHDMHFFTVDNKHFLAAAVLSKKGDFCTDSMIFLWNQTKKEFILHQRLKTSGAKVFQFFVESGNYFLAVANMKNSCGIKGPSMLFKLHFKSMKFAPYQSLKSDNAADIGIFKRRNTTFLLIANAYDKSRSSYKASVDVWKMNTSDSFFTVRQKIVTPDARGIETFEIGNESMVAIAVSRDPTTSCPETNSFIYSTKSRYLSLLQKLFTRGVGSFASFGINGVSYLAFADVRTSSSGWISIAPSLVRIYRYSVTFKQFIAFQAIETSNAGHIEVFRIKKEIFMSIVDTLKGLTIYKFNGAMGFKYKMQILQYGLVKTKYFEIQNEPYLALSTALPENISANKDNEPASKIIKILLSGVSMSHITTKHKHC